MRYRARVSSSRERRCHVADYHVLRIALVREVGGVAGAEGDPRPARGR